jgi:hypothetical protein
MMRNVVFAEVLAVAGLLAGCASAPPPVERMESSTAAIRAAEEVGAPRVPQAALHLQLAKEQSDHAKAVVANGDREQAEGLLMRAEADAELAVALAREDAARSEARQAMDQIRALRQSNH